MRIRPVYSDTTLNLDPWDTDDFDLPTGLEISIQQQSPLFGSSSSVSLPLTLPITRKNRILLNYPDRLDYTNRLHSLQVTVFQDSWQQRATLTIEAVSKEGIEVTLSFRESEIWQALEDTSLPDALKGLYYGTQPVSDDADDIFAAQQATVSALQYLFYSYPQTYDTRHESTTATVSEWTAMYTALSTWMQTQEFVVAPVYTPDGMLNRLREPITNTGYGSCALEEGTNPEITKVYPPITLFLRLEYVLTQVFKYTGAEFSPSDPPDINWCSTIAQQWHSTVLLNNTCDALSPGCIYYSSLVPDMSCKDFINAIEAQFGCRFVIEEGKVSVLWLNSVLNRRPVRLGDGSGMTLTPSQTSYSDDTAESLSAITAAAMGLHTAHWTHSSPVIMDYDDDTATQINIPELEGYCQRTTTTITTDSDGTQTDTSYKTECPLAFAVIRMNKIRVVDNYDPTLPITYTYYYPRLYTQGYEYMPWNSKLIPTSDPVIYGKTRFLPFASSLTAPADAATAPTGSTTETTLDEAAVLHDATYVDNEYYSVRHFFAQAYEEWLTHSFDTLTLTRYLPPPQVADIDILTPVIVQGAKAYISQLSYTLYDRQQIAAVEYELKIMNS